MITAKKISKVLETIYDAAEKEYNLDPSMSAQDMLDCIYGLGPEETYVNGIEDGRLSLAIDLVKILAEESEDDRTDGHPST